MPLRSYLPSTKLLSIVIALGLSAGLVFAADAISHRTSYTPSLGVDNSESNSNSGWEAALSAIQAQNASSSSSIVAPDPNIVDQLLQAVQSPNVTDTVGKSILISLSNAKAQGLGNDVPTQDQIVAAAAQQIKNQQASVTAYSAANLTIVSPSAGSLHTYGNNVMIALNKHTNASERATFLAIDYVVEGQDASKVKQLQIIGADYKAAAADLIAVPVPQTLAPLHLQMANILLNTGATFDDMEAIGSDPVRGLVGLKAYESLMDDGARLFTNIAQSLSKDGILFSKDEPGSAWSVFLAAASPGTSQ
jgi:hypothetical protein